MRIAYLMRKKQMEQESGRTDGALTPQTVGEKLVTMISMFKTVLRS